MSVYDFTVKAKCCVDNDPTTPEDFSDKGGCAVKIEPGGKASLAVSATYADRPHGVIKYATKTSTDDVSADIFRDCTVVVHGFADCIAGADIVPDVDDDTLVTYDTNGAIIPMVFPAEGASSLSYWSLGFICSERGETVGAGDKIRIFVNPQLFGNFYAAG